MRNVTRIVIGFLALLLAINTTSDAFAEGATVITEGGECDVLAGDWSGNFGLFTLDFQAVVTPSGNIKLTCFFDIPDGAEPDTAVRVLGFDCSVPDGTGGAVVSTNSQSISTPGGLVILTCHINGSN